MVALRVILRMAFFSLLQAPVRRTPRGRKPATTSAVTSNTWPCRRGTWFS